MKEKKMVEKIKKIFKGIDKYLVMGLAISAALILVAPVLIIEGKPHFIFEKIAFKSDRVVWLGLFFLNVVNIILVSLYIFYNLKMYKRVFELIIFFSFLVSTFFAIIGKSFDQKINTIAFVFYLIVNLLGAFFSYMLVLYFKENKELEKRINEDNKAKKNKAN